MARRYVCDRCNAVFNTWQTTSFELPASSFFGRGLDVELCEGCLRELRGLINNFLKPQPRQECTCSGCMEPGLR